MSRRPSGATGPRLFAIVLSLGLATAAVFLNGINSRAGEGALGFLAGLTIFGATFWLAWGASLALVGLPGRRRSAAMPADAPARPSGTCVVIVPICNEDPVTTFSRIAAMDAALAQTPGGERFQFAILSDTSDPLKASREERWYLRLLADRDAHGRIFYRRRRSNEGKKAGNLRDFIERSGGAWDYAMILDADSLMEAETMVEMLRRMEAEPRLGLLQTLPTVIGATTLFGRIMQFGASMFSPIYARGVARMQGETGPFWGHNAMVRMRAFAECCGLPRLRGGPPFGGPILSHDYVEAALLARGGWIVRLDEDLSGSYEEGPANIIEHSKRDRRWCQGNLQHIRLIGAPRLRGWSRFVFVQGILAYVASLFWLGFLAATITAAALPDSVNYYPYPGWAFPVFPGNEATRTAELALGVAGLLLLPKVLILIEASWTGRARDFGGSLRAAASLLAELLLACVMAPILLMFQTRSILQVLAGIDGGWPASRSGDGRIQPAQAWAASGWITVVGLLMLALSVQFAPSLVPWLVPIAGPMVFAPLVIVWTSRPASGPLFTVPQDLHPAPITRRHDAVLGSWTQTPPTMGEGAGSAPPVVAATAPKSAGHG